MKRVLLYILPLALLITACGKEQSFEVPTDDPNNPGNPGNPGGGGGNTGYFLKCKIDGNAKSFPIALMAVKTDVAGVMTSYNIVGKANSNPNNFESLNLAINTNAALTTGTYAVDDPGTTFVIAAVYNPNSTTVVWGTTSGDTGGTPFKIVLTSVSATELAGTFSGTFFESNASNPTPNPASHNITEGEFKVKFQ
jgi:hypothetical protein